MENIAGVGFVVAIAVFFGWLMPLWIWFFGSIALWQEKREKRAAWDKAIHAHDKD